jgi:hypothetical protein
VIGAIKSRGTTEQSTRRDQHAAVLADVKAEPSVAAARPALTSSARVGGRKSAVGAEESLRRGRTKESRVGCGWAQAWACASERTSLGARGGPEKMALDNRSPIQGFRMPAHRESEAGTGAGVRKPPGKEPASGLRASVFGARLPRCGAGQTLRRARRAGRAKRATNPMRHSTGLGHGRRRARPSLAGLAYGAAAGPHGETRALGGGSRRRCQRARTPRRPAAGSPRGAGEPAAAQGLATRSL